MINFEPCLNELENLGKFSPRTIKAYRNDLKLFGDFPAERPVNELSDIDHALISAYVAWMRKKHNPRTGKPGLADTTIATRLAAISTFMEYCRTIGQGDLRNPLKEVKRKWQKNSKPNPVNILPIFRALQLERY